jgi:cytochrome bd-type quinol oxidase subunit 2
MFGGIHTDGHGNSIELFNFILAQTGFLLVFILSMRFIAQRIPKRSKRKTTRRSYLFFKIIHIILGFILILVGLIHGLLSASDITSFVFNWGFVCLMLSILTALIYCCRKRFRNQRHWLVWHRILTIMIITAVIIHLITENI